MKLGFAFSTTSLTSLGSGLRPTLDLDFTTDILDSRITFTRASSATRFNSAGLLETVASGQPRFDYDPVTLNPKGFLIEEARTNLLLWSEDFTNAAWAKTRASILANTATGPSGLMSASSLVEDTTASATHSILQNKAFTSGTAYTFSFFLKAATRNEALLQLSAAAFGTAATATFNLATGAVSGTTGGATATISNAGGGWYRCAVTATATATVSDNCILYVVSGSTSYTGTGATALYIYGGQVEAGAFATSYIPTTASAATRAADSANMLDIGWLTQGIGTLACEFNGRIAGGSVICIAQVTSNYAALVGYNSSSQIRGIGRTANVTSPTLTVPGATNTDVKAAYAYAHLDRQLAGNGALSAADTTSPVVTDADRLMIGAFSTANHLNGHIKRIRYWPTRLPDAKLQELTA